MPKATVYLSKSEAEALLRVAARSKRSRSELIREGVRLVLERDSAHGRVFHSMGSGEGGARREARWDSESLYRRTVLSAE